MVPTYYSHTYHHSPHRFLLGGHFPRQVGSSPRYSPAWPQKYLVVGRRFYLPGQLHRMAVPNRSPLLLAWPPRLHFLEAGRRPRHLGHLRQLPARLRLLLLAWSLQASLQVYPCSYHFRLLRSVLLRSHRLLPPACFRPSIQWLHCCQVQRDLKAASSRMILGRVSQRETVRQHASSNRIVKEWEEAHLQALEPMNYQPLCYHLQGHYLTLGPFRARWVCSPDPCRASDVAKVYQ